MDTTRIVLSGSGGQGVITAAVILGEAASVYEGKNAVQTQSYGPEARGGATRADLVVSDADIRYPKVINANILVCLTLESYHKYSMIIRPGGLLITDPYFVDTNKKVEARQVALPIYESVMEDIGNPVVFNICMLGCLIGLTGLVTPESIMMSLQQRIARGFLEMNQKALQLGLNLVQR